MSKYQIFAIKHQIFECENGNTIPTEHQFDTYAEAQDYINQVLDPKPIEAVKEDE